MGLTYTIDKLISVVVVNGPRRFVEHGAADIGRCKTGLMPQNIIPYPYRVEFDGDTNDGVALVKFYPTDLIGEMMVDCTNERSLRPVRVEAKMHVHIADRPKEYQVASAFFQALRAIQLPQSNMVEDRFYYSGEWIRNNPKLIALLTGPPYNLTQWNLRKITYKQLLVLSFCNPDNAELADVLAELKEPE